MGLARTKPIRLVATASDLRITVIGAATTKSVMNLKKTKANLKSTVAALIFTTNNATYQVTCLLLSSLVSPVACSSSLDVVFTVVAVESVVPKRKACSTRKTRSWRRNETKGNISKTIAKPRDKRETKKYEWNTALNLPAATRDISDWNLKVYP